MFGSRKRHLAHFELTIPKTLYADWHRCFVFHRLALEAIRAGLGSPVWLSDRRIAAVSSASIDKANVAMDQGEMSFSIFNYDDSTERVIAKDISSHEKLAALQKKVGKDALPDYLLRYIERTSPRGDKSVVIHESSSIAKYASGSGVDVAKIKRTRGFFGASQMQQDLYKDAIHHLKIFHNGKGKARVFYKFVGGIKFIQNLKHAG